MLLVTRNLFEDTVQTDLASLARYPFPFGSQDDDVVVPMTSSDIPPGMPALTITYNQIASSDPLQSRFTALVNSFPEFRILITGCPSTQVVHGHQIRDYGGATWDSGAIAEDGYHWIYVFYDVTDCGGSHYHGYDVKGQEILLPRLSILYHELSHAYHKAVGDAPTGANPTQTEALQEAQAIDDENKARAILGAPLRDPSNHGGACGFTGHVKSFWDSICFIATAAAGSPLAPSVMELLRFRDGYLRRTELGRTFFDSLFEEYYQFSPALADDIRSHPWMRATISSLCVDPLLAFLRWTVFLCSLRGSDGTDQDFNVAVISYLDESLERLAASGREVRAWTKAALWLYLALESDGRLEPPFSEYAGEPWDCLRSILYRVGATGIPVHVTTWALARPIAMYWLWMFIRACGTTPSVSDDIYAWLGSLPIPSTFMKRRLLERRSDFDTLSAGFVRNPAIRQRLGQLIIEGQDG